MIRTTMTDPDSHLTHFCPQTMCCYGQQLCTIARDTKYFYWENKSVDK